MKNEKKKFTPVRDLVALETTLKEEKITENGIVFLLLLMSVLFSLFRRIGKSNGKIIFLLALMTSMVSNGYLVRPTAAYVLVIALTLQSGYNNEKRSYGK